jgi:hypothetical protein
VHAATTTGKSQPSYYLLRSENGIIEGVRVVVQHQEAVDLLLVQQFFAARGLLAKRIPETSSAKTTDFKILCGAALVAFCEVKSPQDVFDERLTAAILEAPEGQYAGNIEVGPTSRQYRCTKRAAKQAVAQFNSVNPSHSVSNILMFVNHDSHSYEFDFVETITGYVEGLGYASKSVRAEIPEIDAYVWLNAKTPGTPGMLWQQNDFRGTIIELLKPPT